MATRPLQELITDRTQNDVQQNNAKGNYNISDLNRIGEWQQYIMDLLNENGYYVKVTPKTNWNKYDLPRQSDIDKIKDDTMALKDAYYTYATTPTLVTGVNYVTYVDANDIEKIFYDIEYLVNSMKSYFVYSGVAVSGQTHLWQNRFRRY